MICARLYLRGTHRRCAALLSSEVRAASFLASSSSSSSSRHRHGVIASAHPSLLPLLSARPLLPMQCCHLAGQPQRSPDDDEASPAGTGVVARFKRAYKEYGKILVCVHVATSAVWFGLFYFTASRGIDVLSLMERFGAPDSVLKTLATPALGDVAVAYLLYKMATPVRYGVTLVTTHWAVRHLRQLGYMPAPAAQDSIRQLVRDGGAEVKGRVAQGVKDRADHFKEGVKDRADHWKEGVKDRTDHFKEEVKHRTSSLKDGLKESLRFGGGRKKPQ